MPRKRGFRSAEADSRREAKRQAVAPAAATSVPPWRRPAAQSPALAATPPWLRPKSATAAPSSAASAEQPAPAAPSSAAAAETLIVLSGEQKREIHRYETSSKETFSDNIRLGVVLKNLPIGSLREHLILNADKFKTWQLLRDEIANISRAQATALNRSSPMDLDAVTAQMQALELRLEAFKGKAKGKGKGKHDKLPDKPCPICNKPGHWKKDCWWNPDRDASGKGNGHKGGGKGKGKGKDGKPKGGEGKGGYSTKPTGNCFKCGKPGHRAANCKVVNDIQDVQQQPQRQGGDFGCVYISAVDAPAPKSQLDTFYIGDKKKPTQHIRPGMDSCASVSVMPPSTCRDYPIQRDATVGTRYTVANGHPIYDKGRRTLMVHDSTGQKKAIRTRVADVVRPLIAVYDSCVAGNRVVFDLECDPSGRVTRDNSHVYHKDTGDMTPLELNNRTWEMPVDVIPFDRSMVQSPFGRQAARP